MEVSSMSTDAAYESASAAGIKALEEQEAALRRARNAEKRRRQMLRSPEYRKAMNRAVAAEKKVAQLARQIERR